MHFGRKVRATNAVDQFFMDIVKTLKELWNKLTSVFPDYPGNFAQFVEALHTHTAKQRGEQVVVPKGQLAKDIFFELENLENGGFLPRTHRNLRPKNHNALRLFHRNKLSIFGLVQGRTHI
jgi:hypothetical protein